MLKEFQQYSLQLLNTYPNELAYTVIYFMT